VAIAGSMALVVSVGKPATIGAAHPAGSVLDR
jgi:hypothetical protein